MNNDISEMNICSAKCVMNFVVTVQTSVVTEILLVAGM